MVLYSQGTCENEARNYEDDDRECEQNKVCNLLIWYADFFDQESHHARRTNVSSVFRALLLKCKVLGHGKIILYY